MTRTARRRSPPLRRGHLLTEQRLTGSMRLDTLSTAEAFDLLNAEDRRAAEAVRAARRDILRAIELIVDAWNAGGRLLYVGAGTSGRLGVLDAAECPPTFRSPPEMVQGIIAGGRRARVRAVEGAEDDEAAGAAAIRQNRVGRKDVVFGIATGGTTPYVHGALRAARRRGARTVFLACVARRHVRPEADVDVRVLTGPEALTGSTRMKAGLATKMVLNTVTTLAMVRMGKVYENLMVDLNSYACRKLTDRAARTLATLTGLSYEASSSLLKRARGQVKVALVMHHRGVDRPRAEGLLKKARGQVREAMRRREV